MIILIVCVHVLFFGGQSTKHFFKLLRKNFVCIPGIWSAIPCVGWSPGPLQDKYAAVPFDVWFPSRRCAFSYFHALMFRFPMLMCDFTVDFHQILVWIIRFDCYILFDFLYLYMTYYWAYIMYYKIYLYFVATPPPHRLWFLQQFFPRRVESSVEHGEHSQRTPLVHDRGHRDVRQRGHGVVPMGNTPIYSNGRGFWPWPWPTPKP